MKSEIGEVSWGLGAGFAVGGNGWWELFQREREREREREIRNFKMGKTESYSSISKDSGKQDAESSSIFD